MGGSLSGKEQNSCRHSQGLPWEKTEVAGLGWGAKFSTPQAGGNSWGLIILHGGTRMAQLTSESPRVWEKREWYQLEGAFAHRRPLPACSCSGTLCVSRKA